MSTGNEMVVVEESAAPTTIQPLQTVDVEAAKEFMNNYQDLVEALLDDSDYQKIQGKKAKKKSAWRKLATAFNISDRVVHHEETRDETGQIVSAKFFVEATLPNGRSSVGVGECSIYGKIRYKTTPKYPADKETPSNFELRGRYSDAEHDVPATAHTRAKSRAISDLIGAGEVSAEELGGPEGKPVKPGKPKAPKPMINSSNLGFTGKAAKNVKAPKAPKPSKDDEAIEVEAEVITENKPGANMSLKDMIDSNKMIRLAVDELQATEAPVNRATIQDKLLDFMDMGKITTDEYKEAKALLE